MKSRLLCSFCSRAWQSRQFFSFVCGLVRSNQWWISGWLHRGHRSNSTNPILPSLQEALLRGTFTCIDFSNKRPHLAHRLGYFRLQPRGRWWWLQFSIGPRNGSSGGCSLSQCLFRRRGLLQWHTLLQGLGFSLMSRSDGG